MTEVIQGCCIILRVLVCDRQAEICKGRRIASKASSYVRVYDFPETAVGAFSRERLEFRSQRVDRYVVPVDINRNPSQATGIDCSWEPGGEKEDSSVPHFGSPPFI